VTRALPGRSLSTFSFREGLQKGGAAPFPSIPTSREVQELKTQSEVELQRMHADLSSLQHERNSLNHHTPSITSPDPSKGIREYRSLLISDSAITSVVAANRLRKAESADTSRVESPLFRHIVQLPMFRQIIATQQANVFPLFECKYTERVLLREHEMELARQYQRRQGEWLHVVDIVGEYSAKTEEKFIVWPPEFPTESPRIDDALRLRWCAPDQRLYTVRERRSHCFHDMNGFVADPRQAHAEYRERLCWTEEERTVFVEKWRAHAKDFRKIKNALPEKSHKDVIEFYYLNRFELNLRDMDGAAKKRGGKRKVISEGSGRRQY
jgi:hypothetical protein